ncbi:MAG: DUF58 domain-containing protein [Phycisphaerae bacterium]|nr:DUF58 domain-containing protein [Phycisphaerae bacterium]
MERIDRLEMVATRIVDGFLSGRHSSYRKGGCVEFAEHRPYSPGDEIRLIDWRVFARSDRHYIKQFEEETNLQALLLVDASGSMEFGHSTVSKLRYAQVACACLSKLMLGQADAVGVAVVDSIIRSFTPARSNPSHFGALLEGLSKANGGGETSLAEILQQVTTLIKRRGLIIIFSDCFDNLEALLNALSCLRARGHDLLLFHIMAPEELSFPFVKWSRFECLEVQGRRVDLDPRVIRKRYIQQVEEFLAELKEGCGRIRCDYAPISTDQPIGDMLARYLSRRMRRTKVIHRANPTFSIRK